MAGQETRKASIYRDRNSTADRALDVLQLFNDDKLVWSGAEISEQFGVARSTGYRYLKGLVAAGFVEECAGGFRLGPRVFDLARLARKAFGLSEISLPIMRALADEVGETVILTRRSGHSAVCLELQEGPGPIRLSYERGRVLPLTAGASAQILLAWLPESELDAVLTSLPMEAFTERSITNPAEFLGRLAEIRQQGYALSRGELDADVMGIAAPVRAADDTVTAGLSIAALATRIPRTRVREVIESVRAAADLITDRLHGIDS